MLKIADLEKISADNSTIFDKAVQDKLKVLDRMLDTELIKVAKESGRFYQMVFSTIKLDKITATAVNLLMDMYKREGFYVATEVIAGKFTVTLKW